jgi:hypothetical protein
MDFQAQQFIPLKSFGVTVEDTNVCVSSASGEMPEAAPSKVHRVNIQGSALPEEHWP